MKNRQPEKGDKCHYCGQYGHGKRAPPTIRKTTCPAFGKTCGHCGRPNHFDAVCQQKEKPKRPPKVTPINPSADSEGAIFDSLCTTSNIPAATNKIKHPSHWTTTFTTTLTIAGFVKLPNHNHLSQLQLQYAPKITKPPDLYSQPPAVKPSTYQPWPTLDAKVAWQV
jgi:hypothetical protein